MSTWMPSASRVSFKLMHCGGNSTFSEHACGHHHGRGSLYSAVVGKAGWRRATRRIGGVVRAMVGCRVVDTATGNMSYATAASCLAWR
jgi:hypothetical protein